MGDTRTTSLVPATRTDGRRAQSGASGVPTRTRPGLVGLQPGHVKQRWSVLLDMSKRPPWLAAYRVVPPLSARARWKRVGGTGAAQHVENRQAVEEQVGPQMRPLDAAWNSGVGMAFIRSRRQGSTMRGRIFILGIEAIPRTVQVASIFGQN